MAESARSYRPRLILYAARYQYVQKNAVAATLAWLAEVHGCSLEVYYDAPHEGGHYGGGDPRRYHLGALTGGLVSGGRHLEAAALALQRFETIVICNGSVAFSNTVAAVADASGANVHEVAEGNVVDLYETIFSAFEIPLPRIAVMLNAAPAPGLEGIDAYCYPEIVHRQALGIETTVGEADLKALRRHGVDEILTCGVSKEQSTALMRLGFQVHDLGTVCEGDDYAAVTYRLAKRWQERRQGWLIGDPALVAYWLPTACREHRAAIYSIPQARVIEMLADDIAHTTTPVLGRQFEDGDFFQLSKLGQSFQLVDPTRPVLPVLQSLPTRWSRANPNHRYGDPTDEELQTWAQEGRVLSSLVFWTGMMRETENLFALMDLLSLTGLRAGIALTVQSLAWRPSPLDLLTVPRDQGGVFPNVEIVLASCGTGAAIESLLPPHRLGAHLQAARHELEQMGLPTQLWPEGWWATMDAPMLPLEDERIPGRIRRRSTPPYVQVRFHPRASREHASDLPHGLENHHGPIRPDLITTALRRRLREFVRDSRLSKFFEAYRPYEGFEPGPVLPQLAAAVRHAGFSYMLSKSGFGSPPHIVWHDGDFVALNYTAGQWDGWTPFETVNDVHDLRRAERTILASGGPGWLLGGIDTCLWAFSGELWERASGLAAIARFVASGGASGRLINVTPRVLARYARIITEIEPTISLSQ